MFPVLSGLSKAGCPAKFVYKQFYQNNFQKENFFYVAP